MNALHVGSEYTVVTLLANPLARQLCAHVMRNRSRLDSFGTLSQWSRSRSRPESATVPLSFAANYHSSGVTVSTQHTQNRYMR